MNTNMGTKINQLLASVPRGVVLTSSWLKKKGYSLELIRIYKESGWLESMGSGAYIRAGETVGCYGALYALQTQQNMHVHVGARSAFSLMGKAHYLELNTKKVILFGTRQDKLPTWFKNYDWKLSLDYHRSNFLKPDIGLSEINLKDFTIRVSSEARALMECLYLAPASQELSECYEFMESMNNLNPRKVEELLENCDSVKVKRLFLCLAEKVGHDWFNYLELSKVDLGKGKRSFVTNGALDKKYQITVPIQWCNNEPRDL